MERSEGRPTLRTIVTTMGTPTLPENHFSELTDASKRQLEYERWLLDKIRETMARVTAGTTRIHAHDEAMAMLRERLKAPWNSSQG